MDDRVDADEEGLDFVPGHVDEVGFETGATSNRVAYVEADDASHPRPHEFGDQS